MLGSDVVQTVEFLRSSISTEKRTSVVCVANPSIAFAIVSTIAYTHKIKKFVLLIANS